MLIYMNRIAKKTIYPIVNVSYPRVPLIGDILLGDIFLPHFTQPPIGAIAKINRVNTTIYSFGTNQ